MDNNTITQPVPGIYFSPGFYMAFWENAVIGKFDPKTIISHVKFKPYRELWVGAIIAASQSAASDFKHYVAIPDDEPPDVEVARLVPVVVNGKNGNNLERLPIEITRCDFFSGETLIGQITKKNKPAWAGMKLAVYAYGDEELGPPQLQTVLDELLKTRVYLADILIVRYIAQAKTYEVTRVYPKPGQSYFDANDSKAFFRDPEVFRKNRRGLSTEWEHLGSLTLMPPTI